MLKTQKNAAIAETAIPKTAIRLNELHSANKRLLFVDSSSFMKNYKIFNLLNSKYIFIKQVFYIIYLNFKNLRKF